MRTLLVCPQRQNSVLDRLADLLRARRGFEAVEVATDGRAAGGGQKGGFELAFVVLTDNRVAEALDIVRRLHDAGVAHVLVVGPATDPKLILRAMQAGAERFLDREELDSDLDAVLTRLFPRTGAEARQLLAVLSASGGCGASTVAVNLAVVLARAHGRCNLVDLNMNKADLAPLLDVKPLYTLSDLCQNEDRLDRTMYEKLLTAHPSGVALLAGPRSYKEATALTAGGVGQAVALAREAFAHVVVDLENCFHDEQVAVLEQATRVLLVCRLDFTAVRNARRALDHLAVLGVPRDRIEVVINHAGLPNELPVGDAEGALGVGLPHLIPHAPETFCCATNTGVPAAVRDPGSPVVQCIARLIGLDAPAPVGPDVLGRAAAVYRDRIAPWVRSLWSRPARPDPTPPASQAAVETKVCHEPIPAPQSAADPRACTA
jgi:pilus assembly protein CpaE